MKNHSFIKNLLPTIIAFFVIYIIKSNFILINSSFGIIAFATIYIAIAPIIFGIVYRITLKSFKYATLVYLISLAIVSVCIVLHNNVLPTFFIELCVLLLTYPFFSLSYFVTATIITKKHKSSLIVLAAFILITVITIVASVIHFLLVFGRG